MAYSTQPLERFTTGIEFINLNDLTDREQLIEECGKLKYLKTYPAVVRSKIRSIESQIRGMENELSLDIRSQPSELSRIKRKQELSPKYKELQELRADLRKAKDELVHAENVKFLAGIRLETYENLLAKESEVV
ncbi:hypothetical protein [Lysinibacillus xylanilyticus]|uniref:hypothetical protein n=1 Tax=Lysinibacillus xylanilyticus TaxID=582475 RepID=UPI0036DDBDD5